MATLSIKHQVADFDDWKKVFDGHATVRQQHGATGHRVYRDLTDPTEIVVHSDFESREAAEKFLADPWLAEAMAEAGVINEPIVTFLECAEDLDY